MAEKKEKKLQVVAEVKVQATPGKIVDNLQEVKAILKEEFEPFMGKEVTLNTLADAKKSLADARKVWTTIDTKRKSIKKDWNKPYDEWKKSLDDSTKYLTAYINELDGKIKETEQELLKKKMEDIENIINERLSLESENISMFIREINWFRNPKWSNKGETLSNIKKEIDATIDKINQDISIIARDEEFYAPMLDKYKEYGQLGDALALKDRLVIEKERREQLRLEQEAKREQERKELEAIEAEKRRREEENKAKFAKVDTSSNYSTDNAVSSETQPAGSLFDFAETQNEDVVEEESKSVPLTNGNWQQTEYENRTEEKPQSIVEKPKRPELMYGCPKDYVRLSIGYEFRTDVATARYLKELGIFLGAEVITIVPPKAIKGEK